MNSTPVSLLERLRQADDGEAWRRFVLLYTPMLFSWTTRLGMQEADAADFVQEIFALLFRRMPEFRYDPSLRFRGWLRTVAINHWRDQLKRRRIPTPLGGREFFDEQQSSNNLEHLMETEYKTFLMRRALEIMRADFQPITWQAFWQLTVEDKPVAEVSASLGITAAAAYSAKYRVIGRLRQELAGLYPG